MTVRIILLLFMAVALVGCSEAEQDEPSETQEISDQPARGLVSQIISLKLEPTSDGVIILATGLPLRQGYHDGELVPAGEDLADNSVLSFEFRATPPAEKTPAGTPASREIVAVRYVSKQTLDGVISIRVIAAANALSESL